MDRAVTVHTGRLLWCGEHWILGLRADAEEKPSAWISLFHTRFSSVGEGNAAQVMISGSDGVSVIAADRPEIGAYIKETFLTRGGYFDPEAQCVEARFERIGDVRRDPCWIIEARGMTVTARWQVDEPPVIADGTFRPGTEHFTVLFFCNEASVELNG